MPIQIDRVLQKSFRGSPPFSFVATKGAAHPDADHASWWTFEDEQEVRDRWWHPRAGETVLDVGAAFGSYALPALALGARVVCFSPADFDTELLELNLAQNPDLARRCMVVRDGLFSRDGFFEPNVCRFIDQATMNGTTVSASDQWLSVRALDSFLAERPGIARVDWIKLDVEGAELEVLKGAGRCLRSDRPTVLAECHEQHIPGIANQVNDYLAGLGVGYRGEGPVPHGVVSHAIFRAR